MEIDEKIERPGTNETKKTTRKVKVPVTGTAERTGLLRLVWSTLGVTALKVYDFINEGEDRR